MVLATSAHPLLDAIDELQKMAAFQTPAFRHLAHHVRRTIARSHVDHAALDSAYLSALWQTIALLAWEHGVVLRDHFTTF
jgi:hypothetical protein